VPIKAENYSDWEEEEGDFGANTSIRGDGRSQGKTVTRGGGKKDQYQTKNWEKGGFADGRGYWDPH